MSQQRAWSNDVAPANMWDMSWTELISHEPTFWLKAVLCANMLDVDVTALMSHLLMSSLKYEMLHHTCSCSVDVEKHPFTLQPDQATKVV